MNFIIDLEAPMWQKLLTYEIEGAINHKYVVAVGDTILHIGDYLILPQNIELAIILFEYKIPDLGQQVHEDPLSFEGCQ
jgi:hypothetical protein